MEVQPALFLSFPDRDISGRVEIDKRRRERSLPFMNGQILKVQIHIKEKERNITIKKIMQAGDKLLFIQGCEEGGEVDMRGA